MFRSDIVQCHFCGSTGIFRCIFRYLSLCILCEKSQFAFGRLRKFRCPFSEKKVKIQTSIWYHA